MVTILGIDEAGKGPIIGDLVIAGTLIEKEDESKLIEMGVKDSKLISPRNRDLMFKKITEVVKNYEIVTISPQEIDDVLFSQDSNLNKLEAMKCAALINKFNPDIAILDCPSPNIEAYKAYILTLLDNREINLIVEHKADFKYPVVGAASILAKVTRDKGIGALRKKYGEIGSGYPADEVTRKFIKENFELYPEIFRKSWKTFENLRKEKEQSDLSKFDSKAQ
jgi:ribonuclease HII